jgi:hypothetical protein
MWLNELWQRSQSQPDSVRRPSRRPRRPRPGCRPSFERLEERTVPTTYKASTVTALINDITQANTAGGSNTIQLTAATSSPYVLTAVNNTTDGATGLPVITSGDNLAIVGNGDTIERSTASGTPAFRLFDVASGATLTLQKVTLQDGLASSVTSGLVISGEGGAIYNAGTLDLKKAVVQSNTAQGGAGLPGAGGGVYSTTNFGSGVSLTLEGGTIVQNNKALGGNGETLSNIGVGLGGGSGSGGGVYVTGGLPTVTLAINGATVSGNLAQGGNGAQGVKSSAGGGGG